ARPPDGGPVCRDEDDTRAWLSTLNDVRLVIGTRLDVTEDTEDPEPWDPRAPGYELHRWLTLLQELLVEAAGGDSAAEGAARPAVAAVATPPQRPPRHLAVGRRETGRTPSRYE